QAYGEHTSARRLRLAPVHRLERRVTLETVGPPRSLFSWPAAQKGRCWPERLQGPPPTLVFSDATTDRKPLPKAAQGPAEAAASSVVAYGYRSWLYCGFCLPPAHAKKRTCISS